MNDRVTCRRVADSVVEMTEIVLPEDTNARGTIFGGRVLALVDKCAAVVAMRHARTEVVTVSVDSVDFRNPVRLGDVTVGALVVDRLEIQQLTGREPQLVAGFAGLAAEAIQRVRASLGREELVAQAGTTG